MTRPEAPTSTGEPARRLQLDRLRPDSLQPADLESVPVQYAPKPAMPALTGLRTLLALTILLFHFTPAGLRWQAHPWVSLYPLVDIGYVFVSFFFLISGFILAYNYADRPAPMNAVDFWMARFSRLYPVYVLTLLISIPMLITEWHVRSPRHFIEGAILTPLLLQGIFPHLATFWNTVTWTLSCEVMLYLAFPWLLRIRLPRSTGKLLLLFVAVWIVGLIPHSIYVLRDPDHLGRMANRYDDSFWLDWLKFTPLPYICTFLAGLTLGRLHEAARMGVHARLLVGLCGFTAFWFAAYHIAARVPYIMIHGGLFAPVFAAIILGLAGPSPLARIFSIRPLVAVGASTYCLYLLHFNVFILLHLHHVPERLHVARFDPWISYGFIIVLAVTVRKAVERPMQQWIGAWWKRKRAAQQLAEQQRAAQLTPSPTSQASHR